MDVTPKAFNAIYKIDILELHNLSNEEMRPLLPCLARIAFRYKFEVSPVTEIERNTILEIIKKHEDINSIISLLSYDFQAMELDLRKELEQRVVIRTNLTDLKSSINENSIISLDFSRNENFCRHRLIINELLQMQQLTMLISTAQLKETFYKSELFELDVYINEISDVICCAMFELPNTLRLLDICEALLYVRMGPRLICRIAANFCEHFEEICMSLLRNSKQSENEDSLIGKIRTNVLRNLCRMNPSCVSIVRSAAIEMGKMPGLCLHLSLDHMEIFHDNEQNKSARYLNDLVQFVRNILLSNENEAKNWLKDGQKQVDLLEEKILNHSDQNKNEMLYEPVCTLACQVYNRINDLFDLSDDRIESNKELLLMFAHVFTLFNSTLAEKQRFQHEMEDYKDRYKQQQFLNTRERENVNRLKEKLEEYESQMHEDIQKYESEISYLESKIKNLEKDKRKLDYEIEDNLKELKHVHDSITTLLNLIEEYSSNEYGIAQFFAVFHNFVNNVDFNQSIDKTKIINQLNNILEKKLIDVKNEVLRIQEEKILTKIKSSEDRINKIFENGTNNFIKNDFVFEPMLHKIESTNITTNTDYYNEQNVFEFEDDLTERIKHLKKMNQANIDRRKCCDEQISSNNELLKDLDSSGEQLANLILNNLIDECIQEKIKDINTKLKEENKCKLTDILNTGLVKVNSNNEIVANKSNSNLSQAKLMLINENNTANEEHITSFQEDIYNRFEKSLAEIITHSVNQSELSSPEEGETLQSILDSKHNSLNDSINERQRMNSSNQLNNNSHNSVSYQISQQTDKSSTNLNQADSNEIDCKIIEILEEISKFDDFNEIIDKEKLMKKSVCSPKRQNKLIIQLTPEKKACYNVMNGTTTTTVNDKKDAFTNTDLIELKTDSTLTNNLVNQEASTETNLIEIKEIEINTDKKQVKNVSIATDRLKTRNVACFTKDLTVDVSTECDLVSYQDRSISTSSNLNRSIAINCDLMQYENFATNTDDDCKLMNNLKINNLIKIDQSTSTLQVEKASIEIQTKTFYKILTRSSRFIKLKLARKQRSNKSKLSIKQNANISNGNHHLNYQTILYPNNNYLNGNHFNPQNGTKQKLINETTIDQQKQQMISNNKLMKVDYDFVFCHHVPPLVNFLITFLFLTIALLFKMIKNCILFIVFFFFLLQILFYIWPVPPYISWQDILISILEPHITVHHYHSKV